MGERALMGNFQSNGFGGEFYIKKVKFGPKNRHCCNTIREITFSVA